MRKRILLISIFVLFILLLRVRFYKLGSIPVHLGNDEISLAYDAYSISRTGRDEHNQFLPLSFQSHGDYKAPLYVYFSVLPIKVFGNTEFSARVVSAFAGLLTIFVLYLLTNKISNNKTISILSAIVLGFSPWHIYSSRIAWESNLAFFFFILGLCLYLFFQDSQKKWYLLVGSSFAFVFSAYSYHTEKLLSPLFIFFLPFLLPLKSSFKKYFYWVFSAILFLPIVFGFISQQGTGSRANTQMIWHAPEVYNYIHSNHSVVIKFGVLLSAFLSNYSSHLNLGHLFFNGLDLFSQETPYQFGLLLAASLPFLFVGLISTSRYFGKYSRFLLLWTAFSPIISSFTRGEPNIGRNLPSVAPYCVLIAAGIAVVFARAKSYLKIIIVLLHILFLSYFLVFYFVHFPVHSGENWQYGYKQIALATKPIYADFEEIIIDPRFGPHSSYVGVPHLYISFFNYIDPGIVQKRPENNGRIGKYVIREIDWEKEINIKPKSLYVLPESNLPPTWLKLRLVKIIELPTGRPAFRIFESDD